MQLTMHTAIDNLKLRKAFEYSGAAMGLLGAILISLNASYSGLGFIFFLASNVFLIGFALVTKCYGILLLQIGFTITSIMGIYHWLI